MTDLEKNGRPNQKRRTRKDLLEAAARLMTQGRKPSLEEIAEEALVSRATAYRYFPSMDSLLLEASFDVASPRPQDVFGGESADDPVARLQQVDAAFHAMILAHEAPLRMMLANALERSVAERDGQDFPARQNRRSPLIEMALAPAGDQFDPVALDTLSKALALIIGVEGVVVFKDVLQLDDTEALRVKRWAIDALVSAARLQSPPPVA